MFNRYPNTMADPIQRLEEYGRRRRRRPILTSGRRRADRAPKTGPYLPGFVARHRGDGPGQ